MKDLVRLIELLMINEKELKESFEKKDNNFDFNDLLIIRDYYYELQKEKSDYFKDYCYYDNLINELQ